MKKQNFIDDKKYTPEQIDQTNEFIRREIKSEYMVNNFVKIYYPSQVTTSLRLIEEVLSLSAFDLSKEVIPKSASSFNDELE